MHSQGVNGPLGGDAPFGPRPTPDQLPPYSSQGNFPLVSPPATLQTGRIKRASDGGRMSDVSSSDGMKALRTESGR